MKVEAAPEAPFFIRKINEGQRQKKKNTPDRQSYSIVRAL
jgi:hypothetical protein